MLLEFPPDGILLADQDDFDVQIPGGANRSIDFHRWKAVATHCIHGNGQHVSQGLLLFDFDDFAPFVLAAVGANAVGQLGLVAVRTFRKAGRLQRIVGAAGGGPFGGVSAFWIRHFFLKPLLISLLQL
jgi:hypothetical protein